LEVFPEKASEGWVKKSSAGEGFVCRKKSLPKGESTRSVSVSQLREEERSRKRRGREGDNHTKVVRGAAEGMLARKEGTKEEKSVVFEKGLLFEACVWSEKGIIIREATTEKGKPTQKKKKNLGINIIDLDYSQ